VYFYQRDALSLTAEGRLNDPTSPVSANLGFKERVVLVVPPSDATSAAEMTSGGAQSAGTNQQTVGTNLNIESSPAAPGDPTHTTDLRPPKIPKDDAVSVISYFDFVKANGDRVINPGLTIRSSFITGAAARAVTKENKTAEVAKAITGFETLNRADMTAISAMYDVVKTRTDDDEAVAVIAQLDGLFKQVPTTWPVDVFATGSGSAVTMIIRDSDRVHEPVTSRVSSQGFEGLQQYWSSLRESHKLLTSRWCDAALPRSPSAPRQPRRRAAFSVERQRRGWPSGLVASHSMPPLNPVSFTISSTRSLILISKPAPRLMGSWGRPSLRGTDDALGRVVDVEELAAGAARAPAHDLLVAALLRLDALADQGGDHVAGVQIEVVVRAVEVDGQHVRALHAVLELVRVEHLPRGLLRHAVGRVGLFRVAVPEVLLGEGHGGELGVGADRADLDELAAALDQAVEACLLDQVQGHGHVGVEVAARGWRGWRRCRPLPRRGG
jgi:hypothetical protein